MTEKDVQHALYDMRARIAPWPVLIPNVYLYWWESDLLFLTDSNYAIEYEIKLSHEDFMADALKKDKHRLLAGTYGKWVPKPDSRNFLRYEGPKQFYYVCPAGVIRPEEVPAYAGLIHVNPVGTRRYRLSSHRTSEIKRAPIRKVRPVSPEFVDLVLRKGLARFWSLQEHLHIQAERKK